jgi:hypothetical protein
MITRMPWHTGVASVRVAWPLAGEHPAVPEVGGHSLTGVCASGRPKPVPLAGPWPYGENLQIDGR